MHARRAGGMRRHGAAFCANEHLRTKRALLLVHPLVFVDFRLLLDLVLGRFHDLGVARLDGGAQLANVECHSLERVQTILDLFWLHSRTVQ